MSHAVHTTPIDPIDPDEPNDPDPDRDTELRAALAAAIGRRWWNRGTVLLGVALLLLGGFIAGVQVQKAYGDSGDGTAGLPTGVEGLPGGGAFGGGLPGGQSGGADDAVPTTGTVTLVDGDTVYVETADGDLLTIRTDDDTQVRVPGDLSDLETGDEVAVEGEDDGAGTISATTITRSD